MGRLVTYPCSCSVSDGRSWDDCGLIVVLLPRIPSSSDPHHPQIASELAKNAGLKSRHPISVGLRGAFVWAAAMGLGHYAWLMLEDWRKRRVVDRKLRDLYIQERFDDIRELMQREEHQRMDQERKQQELQLAIPARKKVVSFSWKEWLDTPHDVFQQSSWNRLVEYLPMVYSQKDFEYREYLESKVRLMETDLEEAYAAERKRKKKIRRLERELRERQAAAPLEVVLEQQPLL